jgi:hypothetical protein
MPPLGPRLYCFITFLYLTCTRVEQRYTPMLASHMLAPFGVGVARGAATYRVPDIDVGAVGQVRDGRVQVDDVTRALRGVQVRVDALDERGLARASHACDQQTPGPGQRADDISVPCSRRSKLDRWRRPRSPPMTMITVGLALVPLVLGSAEGWLVDGPAPSAGAAAAASILRAPWLCATPPCTLPYKLCLLLRTAVPNGGSGCCRAGC